MQGGVNGYWADEADIEKRAVQGDGGLRVHFYTGKHWRQSMAPDGTPMGGREEFDAPFIRIEKGDPKDKTERLAWVDERNPMSDSRRFPKQWEAYLAGSKSEQTGTPLADWPQIRAGHIEVLRQRGIYTVEQLAAQPDGNVQFLNGLDLRTRARAWLAARDAPADRVAALEAQLAEQKAQTEKLLALAEAQSAPKPKRGRPPKVIEAA